MTTKSSKNSGGNNNNKPQRRDSSKPKLRINEGGRPAPCRPAGAERQKSGNESFVSGRPPKRKK